MHLSKDECNSMRGVAILGIVLHNFCHWLRVAVKENEYTFSYTNADNILNAISNPTWNLPIHLLSFFGHYGVPVFLFLSAYGLTMKYENGGADTGVWNFIKKHFTKLFTLMVTGFAIFTIVDRLAGSPHRYHLIDVVGQLLMFNNLLPDPDHVIWPGPYWFFGLMMQLYIVYRLLLYKRHWGITVALMIACHLLQCLCGDTETLNRLRYNFIGGMLPFGLGLLYGRTAGSRRITEDGATAGRWRMTLAFIAILLMLVIAGWSLEKQTWFFVPAAVCAFSVVLVKVTPAAVNRHLAWIGRISAVMFVLHPATRKIFIPISQQGELYTGLILYIVATIVLSAGLKKIMR